jgi:uncharacterized protein (DUF2235 family)
MGKNLVICLDVLEDFGLSERRTNVLKLYYAAARDDTQLTLYVSGARKHRDQYGGDSILDVLKSVLKLDPVEFGISLFSALTKSEEAARMSAYAFGSGGVDQFISAYDFLAEHYKEGDRVFLFGFSRAASIACMAAGFVHEFGLIEPAYSTQTAALVKRYTKLIRDNRAATGHKGVRLFKETFAKACNLYFLGLWETLEITGWIMNPAIFPQVQTWGSTAVRHAISIDERRWLFRPRLLSPHSFPASPEVQEVWFPGVHSDVGGSYPEWESGLSQVALEWMMAEANHAGLKLHPGRTRVALGLEASDSIPDVVQPDPCGLIHRSLTGPWWGWEFLPHSQLDPQTHSRRWSVPLGRSREIGPRSYVHRAVVDRMKMLPTYHPRNLPSDYQVVDTIPFDHGK